MNNFIQKIIGDLAEKKEWYATEARSKKLPREYRIVYEEIKQYIWKGAGPASIDIFKGLVELFEDAAASGRKVLEITGDDVAAFCDELLRDEKSYIDQLGESLNQRVANTLSKSKHRSDTDWHTEK